MEPTFNRKMGRLQIIFSPIFGTFFDHFQFAPLPKIVKKKCSTIGGENTLAKLKLQLFTSENGKNQIQLPVPQIPNY